MASTYISISYISRRSDILKFHNVATGPHVVNCTGPVPFPGQFAQVIGVNICYRRPSVAVIPEGKIINQLLIYVGLCHFHTTEKVRESRVFPEFNKIAFLLPQQLTLWERDLDDFTISDRENIIAKLKDLAEGKVKEE